MRNGLFYLGTRNTREAKLDLSSAQKNWRAYVGDIRGERLAGHAEALEFINGYFAKAPSGLLFVIYLNRFLRICDMACLGGGSIAGVPVLISEVIGQGSSVNAAGFILVHNQPNGDPAPSQNDIRISRRIRRISKEFGMPLLDHFIVDNGQVETISNL